MNQIAADTFDYDRFAVVTRILWESIDNRRPGAWRVVFKALTLLEHLIKNGSERCVDDGRNHSHLLRALNNFNYYEGTVDRGTGVREKAQQIVELVGDDERIREERQKAKQLREKFGGNLGGVSNGGGGSSMEGIGGGGSGYAGYGNEDKYGGYGGSGSYGNSGIGASGGYSDSAAPSDSGNNFSGRYSEDVVEDSAPTFAAIPEKKPKKKSKKKKKEKTEAAPAPGKFFLLYLLFFVQMRYCYLENVLTKITMTAPEVDLLSMDDPIPAPAPTPAANDNFDAFQAAPATQSFDAFQAAPATQADTFDAFSSAPAPAMAPPTPAAQFDAFTSAPAPSNNAGFDAFVSNNVMGGSSNNVIGGSSSNVMGGNSMNAMNNAFGSMNMMGGSSNVMGGSNNVMGGGSMQHQQTQKSNNDDDFGDFDDGKTGAVKSADPLSNLISLDGLTKNKKNEDKTKEPIAFNDVAKAYIQSGAQNNSTPVGLSKEAVSMAFSGVDGIHKQPAMMPNMPPPSMPAGQSVMGGNGMNSSMISNLGQMGNMNNMGNNMGNNNMMQMQMQQAMMMQMMQNNMMQNQGGMMGGSGNNNNKNQNNMGGNMQGGMGMGGSSGNSGMGAGSWQ